MDQKKLAASIKQVSEKISDEDLSLLISYTTGRELKKGDVLLKEGEVCRAFYLVDKGYLRTWYNKNGAEINLNFTFEGEFISNLKSVKSKRPSNLIIEAGEDASVWVFDSDSMTKSPNTPPPEVSIFIRRLAIRILLAAEGHSNLFKIYTPTERYRHVEKNSPQLLQRISLSQLASYLGMARETLSRIRRKNQ